MATTNETRFTNLDAPNTVPVAEFRAATDHLFRVCRVDLAACGARREERARWVLIARRVACTLTDLGCTRAKNADRVRRERALDTSATTIGSVIEADFGGSFVAFDAFVEALS